MNNEYVVAESTLKSSEYIIGEFHSNSQQKNVSKQKNKQDDETSNENRKKLQKKKGIRPKAPPSLERNCDAQIMNFSAACKPVPPPPFRKKENIDLQRDPEVKNSKPLPPPPLNLKTEMKKKIENCLKNIGKPEPLQFFIKGENNVLLDPKKPKPPQIPKPSIKNTERNIKPAPLLSRPHEKYVKDEIKAELLEELTKSSSYRASKTEIPKKAEKRSSSSEKDLYYMHEKHYDEDDVFNSPNVEKNFQKILANIPTEGPLISECEYDYEDEVCSNENTHSAASYKTDDEDDEDEDEDEDNEDDDEANDDCPTSYNNPQYFMVEDENSPEYEEIKEKEKKGFVDCLKIDRKDKIAKNTWKSYFLFSTHGILSFFDQKFEGNYTSVMPVSSVILKGAVMQVVEKNHMQILIKMHCCNGVTYVFSFKNKSYAMEWKHHFQSQLIDARLEKKCRTLRVDGVQQRTKKNFMQKFNETTAMVMLQNREKLLEFMKKRVPRAELLKRGIYKEPVFGGTLEAGCYDGETVPTFLKKIIQEIEKRGLDEVGIYRKGANVSHLQSLKINVNHRNLDFISETDVHLLAGLLKLYFRDLHNPIISQLLMVALLTCFRGFEDKASRTRSVHSILSSLPPMQYHTLHHLFLHLNKVVEYEAENKMSVKNLSLIFGPALLCHTPRTNTDLQRIIADKTFVVENLLKYCHEVFK